MIKKIKGLIALHKLKKAETLPKNSKELYRDIKRANFK